MRGRGATGFAILVLWSGSLWAQGPTVGVAADKPADPARNRVIQELEAQGYEVREIERDDESRAGLSARLIVTARRIEVKVAVRRNGGLERREAVIQLGPHDEDASTATMRAVEFLRASLIEVGATPASKPDRNAQAKEPARPPQRINGKSPPTMSIGLGAGVLYSAGGLGPNGMFIPSIGWQTGSSTSVRVQAMLPFTSAVASAQEGEVSVRPTLLGLSVGWSPFKWNAVETFVDAGLHAVFLSLSAQAAAGYVAQDKTHVMVTPLVGAGVLLFPGRLRLRLSGVTGPALQREHVIFEGREVARWGEWMAGGFATLEVGVD